MLLIKNAYLIDPASSREGISDILIDSGRFLQIGTNLSHTEGAELINAEGLIAAPGLIDTHAHFRDPGFTYKEDLHTGSLAAARGGYTSVILMANTKPVVDTPEVLADILERGKEEAIHLYSCANVTMGMQGELLVDFQAMADAGAAGFTDDGLPIMDDGVLREALEAARDLGLPVSLHEEDKTLIAQNGINAGGRAAAELGLTGAPREAEIVLVRRDLQIAVETMAPLCIQHISCAESVDLVREARKLNPLIHAEATPHHFALTEDSILTKGTLAKVNPPLRTERDRQAIIAGLKDGTLDLIATDHAPHAAYEKDKPFVQAPSGMIGLETALGLAIRELVQPGYLTMKQMLACLTVNPARFYHLPAGEIKAGAAADLVLFDPKAEWTVETPFASRSSNSPFIGEHLPGVVRYTIADGRIVYRS